ncbi:hypothetical protein C8R46DRAFT_1116657 [Mycena filopes]|nr:hypothetical protein C8R46DRAFT_1116657 [Mycena filopes]
MTAEKWLSVPNVAALKTAIDVNQYQELTGLPWPHPVQNDGDSPIKRLVREVNATLWMELPLLAIAEAYKKRAEDMIAEGTDSDEGNAREVYIEYSKYLALHPDKKSKEYARVFKAVKALENAILANEASPQRLRNLLEAQRPAAAPIQSPATTWTFLMLGLLAVSALPVFLRRS